MIGDVKNVGRGILDGKVSTGEAISRNLDISVASASSKDSDLVLLTRSSTFVEFESPNIKDFGLRLTKLSFECPPLLDLRFTVSGVLGRPPSFSRRDRSGDDWLSAVGCFFSMAPMTWGSNREVGMTLADLGLSLGSGVLGGTILAFLDGGLVVVSSLLRLLGIESLGGTGGGFETSLFCGTAGGRYVGLVLTSCLVITRVSGSDSCIGTSIGPSTNSSFSSSEIFSLL